MKRKGYTPWAARKAPLFTKSLNETYIRLNSIVWIAIVSFSIGLVSGAGLPKPLVLSINKDQYKFSNFRFTKIVATPPVKSTAAVQERAAKDQSPGNTLIVPAIPMANPASVIVPSIPAGNLEFKEIKRVE